MTCTNLEQIETFTQNFSQGSYSVMNYYSFENLCFPAKKGDACHGKFPDKPWANLYLPWEDFVQDFTANNFKTFYNFPIVDCKEKWLWVH